MTNKTALIFGVTGQDGSYLSALLLEKGYDVVGVSRRSSVDTTSRIAHLLPKYEGQFKLVEGDVSDFVSVYDLIFKTQPDEIYNLAAQSHVGTSFSQPGYTWKVDAEGPMNILESIRRASPASRFYQASTSEMFGSNLGTLHSVNGSLSLYYQDEDTPLSPNSPYAIAKVAAHHTVRLYRDAYKVHASSGILFNHESPVRGDQFVTRKITKYLGQLVVGETPKLKLGNIDASRDWGHAKDYVRAMWMMLQQDKPDDYVVATGKTHTVREFLTEAFSYRGLDWQKHVEIDQSLFRPSEVPYLLGNYHKAYTQLGWRPQIAFYDLVKEMVDADARR